MTADAQAIVFVLVWPAICAIGLNVWVNWGNGQ